MQNTSPKYQYKKENTPQKYKITIQRYITFHQCPGLVTGSYCCLKEAINIDVVPFIIVIAIVFLLIWALNCFLQC